MPSDLKNKCKHWLHSKDYCRKSHRCIWYGTHRSPGDSYRNVRRAKLVCNIASKLRTFKHYIQLITISKYKFVKMKAPPVSPISHREGLFKLSDFSPSSDNSVSWFLRRNGVNRPKITSNVAENGVETITSNRNPEKATKDVSPLWNSNRFDFP